MEGVEFVKCILPRTKFRVTGNSIYDVILALFAGKDTITKREVMIAASISSATAARFLAKLVEERKVKRHGAGPTTYYTL